MIRFTTFPSQFAPSMEVREVPSLEALADVMRATNAPSKADLPWWKPARFTGIPNPASRSTAPSLRYDAAMRLLDGLLGDYDGGVVTIQQALAICAVHGIEALVCATASWTPERPRWRIFCPFSRELQPTEHARMMARINGALGGILSPESFTLSQAYYYGNCQGQVGITHGDYLDTRGDLDGCALYKHGATAAKPVEEIRAAPDTEEIELGADAGLDRQAREIVRAHVRRHGEGTMERGARAYETAQRLGDLRHHGKRYSTGAIYELMVADYPVTEESIEDMLGRRQNDAGCDEVMTGADAIETYKALRPDLAAIPRVEPVRGRILQRASDIAIADVDWLWGGWLARGEFHLLAGDKGAGKSTLTFDWAGVLTSRRSWPDGTAPADKGYVVVWSGEDSWEHTNGPRLLAAGADRERVLVPRMISTGIPGEERPFRPAVDMMPLIAECEELIASGARIDAIIVDPVVMAIPRGSDGNSNLDVRHGLEPLTEFARRCNAALIGVTHFSKNTEGRKPLERVTGSLAFGAVPRVVLAAVAEGDDRRLVRVSSNLGPSGDGWRYAMPEILVGGRSQPAQRVEYLEALHGSADELLGGVRNSSKVEATEAWLIEFLQAEGGARFTRDIDAGARSLGISRDTLNKAREGLQRKGVPLRHGQTGRAFYWQLFDKATGEGPVPAER